MPWAISPRVARRSLPTAPSPRSSLKLVVSLHFDSSPSPELPRVSFYHVPVQAVVRGTALGAEVRHTTHRSAHEMCRPQSHDAVRHARDFTYRMIRDLPMMNYL